MSATLCSDLQTKLSQVSPEETLTLLVTLHAPEIERVKMQAGDASFVDARKRAIAQRQSEMLEIMQAFKVAAQAAPGVRLVKGADCCVLGVLVVTLPASSVSALCEVSLVQRLALDRPLS